MKLTEPVKQFGFVFVNRFKANLQSSGRGRCVILSRELIGAHTLKLKNFDR